MAKPRDFIVKYYKNIRDLDMIHIWRSWTLSNFEDPHLLVHLRPKLFTPLTLDVRFEANSLPHLLQQTMEQQPRRARERTKWKPKQNQVTSHSNWPRVLLFNSAHKQCVGVIKGWLLCLTPESLGRFPVNNILMFDSAWCLVMVQIQFSLIKVNKDWTSRTLATSPAPVRPITFHFCLTLKLDVICVSLLIYIIWELFCFGFFSWDSRFLRLSLYFHSETRILKE